MLVLRAHVHALGHAGVRAGVIELMVEMLDLGLVPAVPGPGSLGGGCARAPVGPPPTRPTPRCARSAPSSPQRSSILRASRRRYC